MNTLPTTTTKDNITMTTNLTTTSPTRAQREATVGRLLTELTSAVRALPTTPTTLQDARRLRDRYSRSLGSPPGAGGDDFVRFLQSSVAPRLTVEELDDLMLRCSQA